MFTTILDSVSKEASIAPFFAQYNAFVASLGIIFPIALIPICLVVGLFGRRLSDLVRVVILFAVGFIASVYWLAPMAAPFLPAVPAYAIGLTVGVVAAVLSRMIYNFAYIACIGYGAYNIFFNALFFVEITGATKGNMTVSLAIAVVAVIIALLLRKYLEMIITAGAGGIGIAFFVKQIFDYTASINIGLDAQTTMILAGAILAVPMFIYQYYNRILF